MTGNSYLTDSVRSLYLRSYGMIRKFYAVLSLMAHSHKPYRWSFPITSDVKLWKESIHIFNCHSLSERKVISDKAMILRLSIIVHLWTRPKVRLCLCSPLLCTHCISSVGFFIHVHMTLSKMLMYPVLHYKLHLFDVISQISFTPTGILKTPLQPTCEHLCLG